MTVISRIRYFKDDTVRWIDPWGNARAGTIQRDTQAHEEAIPVVWENKGKAEVSLVRPDEIYAVSGTHKVVSPTADTEILPPLAQHHKPWWQFWKGSK